MVDPVENILGKKKKETSNPVTGDYTPEDTSDVFFKQIKKKSVGR